MENKRVRQGQSRWIAIVYQDGQDDSAGVVAVIQCFVTSVHGTTVSYNYGSIQRCCHTERFVQDTLPSYRKAISAALALIQLGY